VTGSVAQVAAAIRERRSFLLTSHARPDGDAIGSPLALAFALDELGKTVRLVSRDPVPAAYRPFPGTGRIEIVDRVDAVGDAVIVLECSDLSRPEIAGLDRHFVINIDHHLGNEMYGAVNWFDESAAACGEMVADVIDELGVAWTPEIGAHLYLAIATDTGGFRHGHLTARTFEACRRVASIGVDPAALSRQIFDSFGVGRVKLMGVLLGAMELHHSDQLAVLVFDDALLASCGATAEDTEGLVNLPLGAKEVVAVALFKRQPGDVSRVSLRSKGDVDVRAVADLWKGGGHKNASGFTITGPYAEVKRAVVAALTRAIDRVLVNQIAQ
jgi:phosphoesterase RecJ-like protein